ncbi:type I methionyl aminopeptidase [Candidatus Peregrinibacteria bacterium]|nr:type I methionyl aminopeptidase [Candidatus Peregrinibacteria bacterium]
MFIPLKTSAQIAIMQKGGRILANILSTLGKEAKAGITTGYLNKKADELFTLYKAEPSFKGYRGFPASICASVNDEVVHGIPGDRILCEGDLLTIDCGVYYQGWHTDSAITVPIGICNVEIISFMKTAEKALASAIKIARPGIPLGDISAIIEKTVHEKGYSVVHDLTGHGIGEKLHEPPQIPNFGKKGSGPILKPGMTLAIEPIITMGKRFVETKSDNWTVVTKDGSLACQVEHTIAVTERGAEILTKNL